MTDQEIIQALITTSRSPVCPSVWHKPDTVLMCPALKDTISSPDAYTMMMVYRSTQPDTAFVCKISRFESKK